MKRIDLKPRGNLYPCVNDKVFDEIFIEILVQRERVIMHIKNDFSNNSNRIFLNVIIA
jgi:hypothetical protein